MKQQRSLVNLVLPSIGTFKRPNWSLSTNPLLLARRTFRRKPYGAYLFLGDARVRSIFHYNKRPKTAITGDVLFVASTGMFRDIILSLWTREALIPSIISLLSVRDAISLSTTQDGACSKKPKNMALSLSPCGYVANWAYRDSSFGCWLALAPATSCLL